MEPAATPTASPSLWATAQQVVPLVQRAARAAGHSVDGLVRALPSLPPVHDVSLSTGLVLFVAALTGLRLSRSLCFGDGVYLRRRVLVLARIRAAVCQWEAACVAEVERCDTACCDATTRQVARHVGVRAAACITSGWSASPPLPPCPPSSSLPPSVYAGIVPSIAFSADVALADMVELAYVADSVLRLPDDRRWLERYVALLQYMLLRRVSLMEEALLYRRLCARSLFLHAAGGAVRGGRDDAWVGAWRLHRRPTWLAPLAGRRRFLCLPLSYFPVESVLPYLARESWLSDGLVGTLVPRWERQCRRALRRRSRDPARASAVSPRTEATRVAQATEKVQFWFLQYTAPLLRATVEHQRRASLRFSTAQLSAAAGLEERRPGGPLALLWGCAVASCWRRRASMVEDADAAVYRHVRRALLLRAASQATTIVLQVCCPRLSVRYVTELAVAGYAERASPVTRSSAEGSVPLSSAPSSPAPHGCDNNAAVDTLLRSMAADLGWAVVAGVADVALTRFAGVSGHQLGTLLADTLVERLQRALLRVDDAFYRRWIRAAPGEVPESPGATAAAVERVTGRVTEAKGLAVSADDVLAVGRRGGERVVALHDAVVKRALRWGALVARTAATRDWRALLGAAASAWVDVPALLTYFAVAVGYSTAPDVARLLQRRDEALPTRSPVGLRLLLDLLAEDHSREDARFRTPQLRHPHLALLVCAHVWSFEHVLGAATRTAPCVDAHVVRIKRLYTAVGRHRYCTTWPARHGVGKAADAVAATQADARCVLHYSVHSLVQACREQRDATETGAACGSQHALLHPLLDPEETAVLHQPSALAFLPEHVDYFELFSLPYRVVLRQLGLEMVFAYRTAASVQQESRQMAEQWWTQTLFDSAFNPLTSALQEVAQLAMACASVLLLCSSIEHGALVVRPLPLSVVLQRTHTIQGHRDLLRSGVALRALEDAVVPLQQLCEYLPATVADDTAGGTSHVFDNRGEAARGAAVDAMSLLQRRRRQWCQALQRARPELCRDARTDRIVCGLRLCGEGIRWHHVTFVYPQLFADNAAGAGPGAVRPTLADVSFTCPAAGMTAVVGPSGAGKSSLNVLLRRLSDPVAVVECAAAECESAPHEVLQSPVDLNEVGSAADVEAILTEVVRLALLESALPPPPPPTQLHVGSAACDAHSRLYTLRVRPGFIALDGVPLACFDAAYMRRWFGWLSQSPQVQPRLTFAANVRGTATHVTARDIVVALRACGCQSFMQAKGRGMQDAVGPLSGGEGQRLALARVVAGLVARARVESVHRVVSAGDDTPGDPDAAASSVVVGALVLDEPTSKLDAASEAEVLAALTRLQRGGAVGLPQLLMWIVSHRMSSLKAATHMIVVEGGRVTASGHPESVVHANSFVAAQLQLQQLAPPPTPVTP